MRVSIIIVNYNAGDRLADCVASALPAEATQSMAAGEQDEVIVVDNASGDRSLSVLSQQFADDRRLRLVRNTRNQGFAVACNQGVQYASGDFLLFLNPDCVLQPGALDTLVDCARTHPSAGMVGALLLNADGSEQPGGRRAVPTPMLTLVRALQLHHLASRLPFKFKDFNLHEQALPTSALAVDAISGACMLVPRYSLEQVGGLDEKYFLHCEDLDWCMRFGQQGWQILFEPAAQVVHHQGTCSADRRVFVEWHKHRGMMRFYRKFFRDQYPGPLFGIVGAAVWLRFSLWAALHGVAKLPGWVGVRR